MGCIFQSRFTPALQPLHDITAQARSTPLYKTLRVNHLIVALLTCTESRYAQTRSTNSNNSNAKQTPYVMVDVSATFYDDLCYYLVSHLNHAARWVGGVTLCYECGVSGAAVKRCDDGDAAIPQQCYQTTLQVHSYLQLRLVFCNYYHYHYLWS